MKKPADEVTCKNKSGSTWVFCPVCKRQKVLKLLPDTWAKNVVAYCTQCKTENVINIDVTPYGHRVTLAKKPG